MTKTELLLCGWHEVGHPELGDVWAHPQLLGYATLKEAKKIQKRMADERNAG